MAGEGSMQHMRNVLKANKALLDKRINMFERGRRFSEIRKEYQTVSKGKITEKTISKTELALIRAEILGLRKIERRKAMTLWLLILSLVFTFGYVNRDIFTYSNPSQNEATKTELLNKRTKFRAYIEDADYWLRQNRWHNAIFQYEAAQRLFPKELLVKNRLAVAYIYRCRGENVDCDKAKAMIDELLEIEGENVSLHELLASYYYGVNDSLKAQEALSKAAQLSK